MNRITGLLTILLVGCSRPEPTAVPMSQPATGHVAGRVVWDGPVPRVEAIQAPNKPADYTDRSPAVPRSNPHLPRIDATTNGLADAIVLLRGIDPARARTWDHPPVRVEIADGRMLVHQGDRTGMTGLVRAGDSVEFVSREPGPHLIRARGVEFFSQPLSRPDVARSRAMTRPGFVELSSGSGYFWMRGHLLVAEHPHVAITDATGRFEMKDIPEGEFEVVARLPNWRESGHDLNADTGFRTATRFAEPLTRAARIAVRAGQRTEVPALAFAARP